MQKRFKSRFLFCDRWLDRQKIVRNMEAFQDLIVIVLCLALFTVMLIQLWGIFISITQALDYKQVTAKMLFVLILVELFRLLIVYLQEHSIAVGVAVEVAIVSVLREVVVYGAIEISGVQTAAICGLLFILGGLLIVCAKTPHMDCISANTKLCPIVNKGLKEEQNQVDFRYSRSREEDQLLP
ncbi:phosphate-starvation-inducible PsiE family protein [Cronbergia sp. UHCC 0137]|uniref:phosphate-starvation-inducible PsiE family protein n=1 Tax=Cronbergia sp. UHCC 0137 TaxID=3110239 RepID=UPI002B21B2D3|nr:phosphate-starvation-inducible PsiE family protein [Cronbergia sp. UHCC 0137]MEA5617832.1 phosphate-starvation-inducible PsiE family protein [Cronbergia sp. UHCC 0137]